MQDEHRKWLINFLKTHSLNEEYALSDLFYKYYAEQGFDSIEEYIEGIDDFFDFLLNHINFIKVGKSMFPNRLPSLIEGVRANAKMHFSGAMFESQKEFASQVTDIIKNPSATNLLDVGAGHFPISSLFMAKKVKRVTAMDSYFFLSSQALKNMNVFPLTKLFDDTTDISNYDLVVGRAPCSAIRPIVNACQKTNKPYFLYLCDCALPSAFASSKDSLGWENMLPNIDPNIHFYGQYAFNLGSDSNQVYDVLKNFTYSKQRQKRIPISNNTKILKSKTPSLDDLFIFE